MTSQGNNTDQMSWFYRIFFQRNIYVVLPPNLPNIETQFKGEPSHPSSLNIRHKTSADEHNSNREIVTIKWAFTEITELLVWQFLNSDNVQVNCSFALTVGSSDFRLQNTHSLMINVPSVATAPRSIAPSKVQPDNSREARSFPQMKCVALWSEPSAVLLGTTNRQFRISILEPDSVNFPARPKRISASFITSVVDLGMINYPSSWNLAEQMFKA